MVLLLVLIRVFSLQLPLFDDNEIPNRSAQIFGCKRVNDSTQMYN